MRAASLHCGAGCQHQKLQAKAMSSDNRCKECGKVVPADSPGGLCAQCLLSLGLELESKVQNAEGGELRPAPSEGGLAGTQLASQKGETLLAIAAPPTEKAGDRIGRYRLLQEIGHGGCGVVYMSEQEEPVRRKVALKVIKLGMDTKQVVARFEAQRQALALMDHPNIARVLDANAPDARQPYFV